MSAHSFTEEAYDDWIRVDRQLPPEWKVVMTKIDDHSGIRNEQELYRLGNLWWCTDGSMYVYYTPTHWKPCSLSQ